MALSPEYCQETGGNLIIEVVSPRNCQGKVLTWYLVWYPGKSFSFFIFYSLPHCTHGWRWYLQLGWKWYSTVQKWYFSQLWKIPVFSRFRSGIFHSCEKVPVFSLFKVIFLLWRCKIPVFSLAKVVFLSSEKYHLDIFLFVFQKLSRFSLCRTQVWVLVNSSF